MSTVVLFTGDAMGQGDESLGRILSKSFFFALSQQQSLPETIIFYNAGVKLTCRGSDALEDLKSMEKNGVKILCCGTCLNFFNLTENLEVGEVSNMYDIVEALSAADKIIRP